MIDRIDYEQYLLTPITSDKEIRKIERQEKIEAQAEEMMDEIAATAKRFGSSKFSTTDYEKSLNS